MSQRLKSISSLAVVHHFERSPAAKRRDEVRNLTALMKQVDHLANVTRQLFLSTCGEVVDLFHIRRGSEMTSNGKRENMNLPLFVSFYWRL